MQRSMHVRMQSELERAVDDCRRSEADLPTRPEMVRRLLQAAVTARQAEKRDEERSAP
jgi:metal-responsive CopG/Arc/MetJ family transcriptional regulator